MNINRLITNGIVIIFLCSSIVFAADNEFPLKIDQKSINKVTEVLINQSNDFLSNRQVIDGYRKQIDDSLLNDSENSVFWYLKGKIFEAELNVYYLENKDTKFKDRKEYYTKRPLHETQRVDEFRAKVSN